MASLFSSTTPTRPLILHSPSARVSVPVPASPLSAWVASEVLAQDFHDSRVGLDEQKPLETEEDEQLLPSNEPQVLLLARFLSFVADKVSSEKGSELSEVLLAAYNRFNELFLSSINIHSLVQTFEPDARVETLTSYFKAFAVAREEEGAGKVKIAHQSALLESAKKGESELYALFGGQGVNEVSLHHRTPCCVRG